MVKVLHVVNSMNRGGIETFLMNIYRNIDRKIIQFDFLLHEYGECDYKEEILTLGGKLHYIPSRRYGILQNKRALNSFFQSNLSYQVVHLHVSSLSYIEPLKVAMKYNVPTRIIHAHSTHEGGSFIHNYLHSWNQKRIKAYATDYLACSDSASLWFSGQSQKKVSKYKIINNGIETERFIYNPEIRKRVRDELKLTNKFVMGNVGSFSNAKNHSFLIDIFYLVNKQYPDSVLVLVGDGRLREKIEKKIIELNLHESVILLGVRSDVSEILQAFDVFVMPSLYEGLPVALIEAQAAGLPCVISDIITNEVKITEYVKFMSLECSAIEWSKAILEQKEIKRIDTSEKIKTSGYDIKSSVKVLEELYLKNKIKLVSMRRS